jgi:hypothetical protein
MRVSDPTQGGNVKRVALVCALIVSVAVVAAQAAASPARLVTSTEVLAGKKPVTSGFFQGKRIGYFDFGPIKLKPGNKLAPIWTVTNGADGQSNIVDTVPGQPDYSPLWQVNKVTWKDGVTPRLLTSADAVKQAEQAGDVTVEQTSTVVNCPVLGFGQKRVAGYSAGRIIHYYDLGPVKVAPGNDVVPLYAPTNGVRGQHNVAADAIKAGQTDYPPLWGIVKVTWKPGADKTLLRSKADILKAQAAGSLTVTRTTLVVNCPIV